MKSRPDLAAYALAGVLGLCITVLAALQVSIPEVLGYALVGALGGGAGASLPHTPPRTPVRRKAS